MFSCKCRLAGESRGKIELGCVIIDDHRAKSENERLIFNVSSLTAKKQRLMDARYIVEVDAGALISADRTLGTRVAR